MKDIFKKIFRKQVYSNEEQIAYVRFLIKVGKVALVLGIIMLLVGYFNDRNLNMGNFDSISGVLIGGSLGLLIISPFMLKRLEKKNKQVRDNKGQAQK